MTKNEDNFLSQKISFRGNIFLMHKTLAIVTIVIILLLVWCYGIVTKTRFLEEQLCGMWIATPEFCRDSEIDGMMLYIGPKTGRMIYSTSERRAFLTMYSDGNVAMAKPVNISTSIIPLTPFIGDFVFDINHDIDIMPESLTVKIAPGKNKMTWLGDNDGEETVYAEFQKDNSY